MACLLLWIGTHLLAGEDEAKPDEEGREGTGYGTLLAAVRTILLADLVMSLDNVIAVAAAARGNPLLLVLGLGLSIPLVIFGSTVMIRLMERFPVIVLLGAGIIGWVAGDTIAGDSALRQVVADLPWLRHVASVAGALGVLALGHAMNRRALARQAPTA